MHFTVRSAFGIVLFVASVIALNSGPDRVGPWAGVSAATRNASNASGTSEDGEIWVTALIDPRPGIADRPDSLARKGSNLYVTVRFSGQVARIKTQTGSVEYIDVAPPAATGYAVHWIAIRP